MKTLIKDAVILTMDQENHIYSCGCAAIEGDTIVFVGDEANLPKDFIPDKTIEARGKLMLPGFINAHTHAAMSLFRGHANDADLWEWLTEKIWPLEDRLGFDDTYWLTLLSIAEMIAGGVTAFADMYMFMDYTAQAVEESGVRAALSRGLMGPDAHSQERLTENRLLWERWHGKGDGRIKVMVGPHAIYTCSGDYLQECMDLAREIGVGVHIHLAETRKEVEECKAKHGKTPVEYLLDIGLFELPVLAAHCVHLTSGDMDIMAEKKVKVAHCPASNLKLGSGFAPVPMMLERGITVALGTDGAASNNNLSIMKEMMLTALVNKGLHENPVLVPAAKALKMATLYGAEALGWEQEIGSIEKGKKADLILINLDKPHYHPRSDYVSHIVYSGYTTDVDTVMVNGKVLLQDGEFLTLALERIYREVERIQKRIIG